MGATVSLALVFATRTVAEEDIEPRDAPAQPWAAGFAGIYGLRQSDPVLTGEGVKIGLLCRSLTYVDGEPQNDYRPAIEHDCFAGKKINFNDRGDMPAGISPHSTAICSILLGEDANAFSHELGGFCFQGIAPGVELDVHEFWHFLINNVFGASAADADVIAASIGSRHEDWWTRGMDAMVEHSGVIVVAGIGNGLNAHDPLLYPGAGANAIGVGVVSSVNTESAATNLEHFALAYPQDSSFGPTVDGRCKPDIVAPGNCLAAAADDPKLYEATGNWSSFSTPIVAGTVSLLLQKARQDSRLYDAVSPRPGNCVIKAILMNSAAKLPYWHKGGPGADDDHYSPLDYIQGAGMLNALGAYRQLVAGPAKPNTGSTLPGTGWDNNILGPGENAKHVYTITVPAPADKFITVTAVWNRRYENQYPFDRTAEPDSDLRIELWAVDNNKPHGGYLLDYSDSAVDNVEHIWCRTDPNCTNYKIILSFGETEDEARGEKTQRYALAWNLSEAPREKNIFWYDLNADGIVDKLDFITLTSNWIISVTLPGSYFIGDINANGVFDATDLEIFLNQRDRKADWYVEDVPDEQNKNEYARNSRQSSS